MEVAILEKLTEVKTDYLEKKIIQDQEKNKTGKYKQVLKTIDQNLVEYSVTEYVCPNGNIGFDILFYKTIDNIGYIKSVCFGEEASQRQSEWAEIINSSY